MGAMAKMEQSFKEKVKSHRFGAGDTLHGEGILAVTKTQLISMVKNRRSHLRHFHDPFTTRLATS